MECTEGGVTARESEIGRLQTAHPLRRSFRNRIPKSEARWLGVVRPWAYEIGMPAPRARRRRARRRASPSACGFVDDDRAGRAVPARLERRAAGRVPERLVTASRPTAGAPVGEQPEGAREVARLGGEGVLHAQVAAGCTASRRTIPSRSRRRSRSDRMFGAMPGSASLELVEPSRAVEQRLDEEQAPAIADAVEAALERARIRGRRPSGSGLSGHRTPW